MCNMLRQSISAQVMQTLASLLLHYDQIPTAHLALKYTFIYRRIGGKVTALWGFYLLCAHFFIGRVVG